MSFAFEVKGEICHKKHGKPRLRTAQAYGLLLFGRRFSQMEMGLTTERRSIARLYMDFVCEIVGSGDRVTLRESRRGKNVLAYGISVENLADRQKILQFFGQEDGVVNPAFLTGEGELAAFLSGVYLACGTVTDPQKNYLLEFTIYNPALEFALSQLLEQVVAPPKVTEKRGLKTLYYRESEHIEDMLTVMGASKCALEMMEVKIYKDMRNKVNRVTNCETANIDKTVTAASEQVACIQYLYDTLGEEGIPEELRELSRLRLENPDLSLRELCELLSTPISRSGVNHRLKRLRLLAQEHQSQKP